MVKVTGAVVRQIKAEYLLLENIRALLAARGVDAKALAFAVGHSQAWISKILNGDRKMSIANMDKIAAYFGLTAAQLLSPGISALTERRRGDRRKGDERRQADRRSATQGNVTQFRQWEHPKDRKRQA